ncbi:hypothetical protein QAD02_022718 [Eretmocerus hayati]|uniref:Uncharacterized protein n=1 Tax=Eretmocerus hayati TaxID=131215 RepID=A0ACC2PUE6_9HYME|nr:hypothetical protein QAD02_022718 [Eretmocerus hayati]
MRWIGFVATILWWSGIARTLSSMNRGYKISPKPCRVPGQPNVEGTSYSHQSSGTRHPSASSRPSCRTGTSCSTQLQKKPHSKPNNSPEQDFYDHQHQQYQNNSITRRPQIDMDTSYHEKRPEEDRQHNGGGGGFHHYSYHQGYKDKVPSSQNSLLVRVPSKNSQHGVGSSSKNSYHHRPISSYQDEEQVKTDEQAQDLSVQETVHRPSINSLDDDEASDKVNDINFIHSDRPQWATKPGSSHSKPEYLKPYFSVKISSTSTTTSTTTRKPPTPSKLPTTPASTSYYHDGVELGNDSEADSPRIPQNKTDQPSIRALSRHLPPSRDWLRKSYAICWSRGALWLLKFPWTLGSESGRQLHQDSNTLQPLQDLQHERMPSQTSRETAAGAGAPDEFREPAFIIAPQCLPASERCELEEAVELQLRQDWYPRPGWQGYLDWWDDAARALRPDQLVQYSQPYRGKRSHTMSEWTPEVAL